MANIKVKRNQFDLSETNCLSIRMGDLVPVYVNHLTLGDTFKINAYYDARFAAMQAPLMSHIILKSWCFAVPYRLVWDDYAEFFMGKNRKGDDVAPFFPRASYIHLNTIPLQNRFRNFHVNGSLGDYLDLHSIPVNIGDDTLENYTSIMSNWCDVSMLEPRGYQMIYNEWFRDQNLDEEVEFGTDSYVYDFHSRRAEEEYASLMTLRKKRWDKDYFTSALPSPTMADDVFIPIDSNVVYADYGGGSAGKVVDVDLNYLPSAQGYLGWESVGQSEANLVDFGSENPLAYDPNGTLRAIENQTTIRDLVRAKATYKYLLDIARGGAFRWKDFAKSVYGVTIPDYRAEIPEFCGAGQQNVIISEVLQTSETNITPQGNMSGRAVSASTHRNGHYYEYTAKEPTILMVIVSVLPTPMYMSGIPKRHTKFDKFDYYTPQFDHIGDQEIKRKELQGYLSREVGEETFGYAPRYAEYKSSVSRVHGEFRGSLNYWTMARGFDEEETPMLNSSFVEPSDDILDRPFYVQSTRLSSPEQIYLECNFKVTAYRPMSKLSTPII